jgi:hypothetical protein
MRVSVVSAALILAIAGAASAQEYVEYTSPQDRFGVTFPVQPKVEETMFKSQFGSMLPARIYTADSGSSHFKVTVVDYNNIEAISTERAKSCPPGAETCRGGGSSTGLGYWKADLAGATTYAQWQFMQRDAKITYLGWNNIDLVEGTMIYMTNNADKSRTSAGSTCTRTSCTSSRARSPRVIRSRGSSSSRFGGSTRTATASGIRRCITTAFRSRPRAAARRRLDRDRVEARAKVKAPASLDKV